MCEEEATVLPKIEVGDLVNVPSEEENTWNQVLQVSEGKLHTGEIIQFAYVSDYAYGGRERWISLTSEREIKKVIKHDNYFELGKLIGDGVSILMLAQQYYNPKLGCITWKKPLRAEDHPHKWEKWCEE